MIHSYEPYKIEDTYTDFVTQYYDLLSEVEDYFKDTSITAVPELVDDTTCKMSEWRHYMTNRTRNFAQTPESVPITF